MARAPTPAKGRKAAPQVAEAERPKNLPHGSWHGDFPRLSPAEKRLLECAWTGKPWAPENWNGKRPEKGTAANRLRAGLIRFLLLGGDATHPVHRRGLSIEGAWIANALDLEELRSDFQLGMFACHFAQPIMLRNARLCTLNLNKSSFPGLDAQGAEVKGDVFLRNAKSLGEASLSGASIGGQLACEGAKFRHTDTEGNAAGDSLNAEGVEVKGDVFLRNAESQGEVSLAGALIGGQLSCEGAKFRHADKDGNAKGHALNAHSAVVKGGVFLDEAEVLGEVGLAGASIGGQLSCEGAKFRHANKDGHATGKALNVQGVQVKGEVFLMPAEIVGTIDFTAAVVSDMVDSRTAWPQGDYVLNGLTYQRLHSGIDATERIAWLRGQWKGHVDEHFAPQPWEQLIKVLRDMGHPHQARVVAIAKQKAMRRAGVHGLPALNNRFGREQGWRGNLKAAGEWCMLGLRHPFRLLDEIRHDLFGFLTGYGHAPWRILGWTLAIWAGFAGLYWQIGIGCQELAQCPGHIGPALSYSVDALLPADLGLVKSSLPFGDIAAPKSALAGFRFLTIAETLLGWVLGFLIISVIGSMIRKD